MTASPCPACGANAFVAGPHVLVGAGEASDGGACSRCGYTSGESNRCPHCGAVARIEGSGPSAVCAMCGGPRIVSSFGGDTATNALREQKKALANARMASVATVLQAIVAAVATLIGLAILPASIVGRVIVFAIAVVPLVLALRSRSQAAKARESAKTASDRAWQAAAEDVAARAKEGITVGALAKALGIEPDHADKLLTALTVHERTRIDVSDDAEVRYSVRPEPLESKTVDAGVLVAHPLESKTVDAGVLVAHPLARVGEELPEGDELADDGKKTEHEGRPR